MNKFTQIVILILLLIIIVGGIYYSNRVGNLESKISVFEDIPTEVISTPELVGETPAIVSKKDGVLVPKIEYRDTGSFKRVPFIVYDTITDPFDTTAFLTDYLSLRFYMDSIESEDVTIKVFDTLQKNSIFARSYSVNNHRTEDFYKRRMLYLGGSFGGGSSFFIGPNVQYADKRNNLFGVQYLFDPNGGKTFLGSYSKKLTLKKNK